MRSSGSLLRQLSAKEAWKSTSNRWMSGGRGSSLSQTEGLNSTCGNEDDGSNSGGVLAAKKRVLVVVDHISHSKHATVWALTHVANKGDLLTLLHVVAPPHEGAESSGSATCLVDYLGSLCKELKPEVEVEALVIQGPKLATVMSQVKKLEVSVLVLGQKKPSPLFSCLCGSGSSNTQEFAEHCINNAECLAIGVRKRGQGTNGYLITTKWQKNFWLLA